MATDFNVGANVKAKRKLLKTYVDVSSSTTPEWELVGKGVEDSKIELNPDTKKVTDICGITETSVEKWEPSQSLDPNTVRGGSKLNLKLHQIFQNDTPELLSNFTVLTVFTYLDGTTTGTFEAETQTGCTINLNSIGGSAYVDMPIEISYSGNKTKGSVAYSDNVPTFTADD